MAENRKATEAAAMDPTFHEIRGELSNRGRESLANEMHTWAATTSKPGRSASARRVTNDNAQAGMDHAVASPARGGTPRSQDDLATRRRALLHRGAGSAVLIAFATIGRRAFAADTMIAIDNFTFSPTPLTVAQGTTVSWVNRDDIPHAIYCPALNLRSQPLETNDMFLYRFEQAGTFDYICSIHPHMHGRIVVSG
jgi:plastocyanin